MGIVVLHPLKLPRGVGGLLLHEPQLHPVIADVALKDMDGGLRRGDEIAGRAKLQPDVGLSKAETLFVLIDQYKNDDTKRQLKAGNRLH